ncbi:hypothetical protein D3C75_1215470 [compost metagenome]
MPNITGMTRHSNLKLIGDQNAVKALRTDTNRAEQVGTNESSVRQLRSNRRVKVCS